jgi:hypothetical protein
MFNSLNISKEWNIPQARRTDALVVPCFNCGDPKHGVPKCPKPLDQSRIDKAKSEFVKNGGGRNECNKGFRNFDSERRGGGAGTSGDKNYNRGKWKGDTKATNATIPDESGVGFHNGQWCMMCKQCGWNKTHTSGYHASYVANPRSFSLPAHHTYWGKSVSGPPSKESWSREKHQELVLSTS